MMKRYELTDQEWNRIAPLLPPEKPNRPGRPSKDNRTMLNAMVWICLLYTSKLRTRRLITAMGTNEQWLEPQRLQEPEDRPTGPQRDVYKRQGSGW